MLGCNAVGELLPPFVIWKGSTNKDGRIRREIKDPAKHGLADGMHYAVQPKAWMDENTMVQWVQQVWKPFAQSKEGPTVLIIDEAASHLTRKVKYEIAMCGTELEVIPGGYTSKLQVMDVGLNKPFKDRLRECVEEFTLIAPIGLKPTRKIVSKWIKKKVLGQYSPKHCPEHLAAYWVWIYRFGCGSFGRLGTRNRRRTRR